MNLDPAVWVAVAGITGLATAVIAHWAGRRQRQVDVAKAVQDAYQELIADLRAQVAAAHQEATTARTAAREAKEEAAKAEHQAWRAGQQVAAMARFLTELRPLIAAHVPGADELLDRIDKLTAVRP